jgi:hypothetical protein
VVEVYCEVTIGYNPRSDARGSICQEDPAAPGGNKSTSIGIQINGNDNFITDTIIFEFTHIGGSSPGR